MKIFLSIIITVYNGEEYIERLLSSIFECNTKNMSKLEIIIVDDGSKDNSLSICKDLTYKYNQIRVFHQKNGGIASARNLGLSQAKGEYVTFCDQDDSVVKGYMPFLETMENSGSDVLISNYFTRLEDKVVKKEVITKSGLYEKEDIYSILSFFIGEGELMKKEELLSKSLPVIPSSIWNGIYRREMLDANSIIFHSFVDYEDDWLFIISNLFAAKRLLVTKDAYYCWSINPLSESHSRKYIPDFYTKRKTLYEWVDRIVDQLPVSREKVMSYREKVKTQTVLWGFYNACNLQLSSYLREMACLDEIQTSISDDSFRIGRLGRLYLYLLRKHYYKCAYYINNYTNKRSYH